MSAPRVVVLGRIPQAGLDLLGEVADVWTWDHDEPIPDEVREAQRARGLERSLVALTVPIVVRMLKMSDDIAAAIDARSYDPDRTGH